MIVPALLALTAILLVAAGTPRQSTTLFGDRADRKHRRALRLGGFAVLAASFVIALIDDDRARHVIAYLGTIGVEACIVAILFTWRSGSSRR
jgi:hypothetical protein